MPEPPQIIYWDSSVFISYINETPARIDVVAELLERAARGEIQIVTSTVAIVEVAFSQRNKRAVRCRTMWSRKSTRYGRIGMLCAWSSFMN